MNFVSVVLIALTTVESIFAKVKLSQGVNQRITFEGKELEIVVDGSRGTYTGMYFTICFGSTSDASSGYCPKGYVPFITPTPNPILRVDRRGRLFEDSSQRIMKDSIKFYDDGSLDILVKELYTDASTVTLPNAKKWAPKEPETDGIDEKEVVKSTSIPYIITAFCFLFMYVGFLQLF